MQKSILGLLAFAFMLFVVFETTSKVREVSRSAEKATSTDRVDNPVKNPFEEPQFVALHRAQLDITRWWKSGFGSVMLMNATVTNPTATAFKDFTIKCTLSGPSGTVIDSNTRTIYDFVPAKSKKQFREINMGLIHSQAAGSDCEITDLVLASPAEQARLEAEAQAATPAARLQRLKKMCAQYKGAQVIPAECVGKF